MHRRSIKTFNQERESFENIKDIFWRANGSYPVDPFAGILEELGEDESTEFDDRLTDTPDAITTWPGSPNMWNLRETRFSILNREDAVSGIGKAAGKSNTDFAGAFWDLLGVDIEEELDQLAGAGLPGDEGVLRALTARFGTDAFGTYCPWHAFGDSSQTPWGIYMFLEKLLEWAVILHTSGLYLPTPKPDLVTVFRRLWWITYRHELFHFHVELYATRLESALRHPIYRPYVERVRTQVANTPEWWEEALAQAVVIGSKMVKRALGIDAKYIKAYIVPYFRTFPEGYKRFECASVPGRVAGAHAILSAQIARATVAIHNAERNTALSLAKDEYSTRDDSVPGYLVLRPAFRSRFQLQTPRMRDVERYVRQCGSLDEKAPGDHKRAIVNGQAVHLNRAKGDDTVDLATAKALARALGITVFQLSRMIA